MEQLQWKTENRRVDDLLPHKKIPRKISKEQMELLKRSLETFNLVEIPAIDLDGTILAGHQRIKVLQTLGRGNETIDVRVPNRKLTDDEAERYLIGSNAIHAEWDFDLLKNFDVSLLANLGFNQKELDDIWNRKLREDTFSSEAELAKIKNPVTKPGDIIELGRHRSKILTEKYLALYMSFLWFESQRGLSVFLLRQSPLPLWSLSRLVRDKDKKGGEYNER